MASHKDFTRMQEHAAMQIDVVDAEGKTHTLDVAKTDTVNDVLEMIHSNNDVHNSDEGDDDEQSLKLYYKNLHLSGEATLQSCGVTAGSTLRVKSMSIKVTVSGDQTLTLDVAAYDTVADVLKMIKVKVDDGDEQNLNLFYKDNLLPATLRSHGVVEGSELVAKKIYKKEDDFGDRRDYDSYVYQQLKPGMTVKATCDLWWDVKTGDTGGVVETGNVECIGHCVNVRWRRVGREAEVACWQVEIVE